MAISNAPRMSNCISTGITSGGRAKMPSISTNSSNTPTKVTANIPMIIAPGIFLIESIEIIKKPMPANNVLRFVKSPKLKKVAPLATIIPPFLRPMKPMNKPTPAPIAILKLSGILSSIHLLSEVMLIIKNNVPAIKTAPRATSQVYPISPTTV